MAEKVVIGDAELWHGDCREVLPLVQADAVVTDPPYGINVRTGNGTRGNTPPHATRKLTANKWAPVIGDDRPFDPMPLLGYATVVIWGANYYCSRVTDGMKWLVWDKREGVMQNDNSDCEMAWTNQKGPLRIHRQLWAGLLQRGEENGQARVHPTQKPVALMRWCMEETRVPTGATVFDPYMGSGSTGVAAMNLGMRFVGVEIHRPYFDEACRRIEKAYAQPRLFEDAKVGTDNTVKQVQEPLL